MQVCRSVFDAAERYIIDYVTRIPNNKKIADPLVKNNLYRYARIGATQNYRERMLSVYQLSSAHGRLMRPYELADDIPFVALGQSFQSLIGINYIGFHIISPHFYSSCG